MSKIWTVKELEKETCLSFGGNNCVLHGCMFDCALREAKRRALKRETNLSDEEIDEKLKCI
nr:MAG TPA: hypothetical protein [Caudoviricetes sp.]